MSEIKSPRALPGAESIIATGILPSQLKTRYRRSLRAQPAIRLGRSPIWSAAAKPRTLLYAAKLPLFPAGGCPTEPPTQRRLYAAYQRGELAATVRAGKPPKGKAVAAATALQSAAGQTGATTLGHNVMLILCRVGRPADPVLSPAGRADPPQLFAVAHGHHPGEL